MRNKNRQIQKRRGKLMLTEKHHRRPRSLNGSSDLYNISYVTPDLHDAWHILFSNLNAEQICNKLNSFSWIPKGITVICIFINGHPVEKVGKDNWRNEEKIKKAWNLLFKRSEFKPILNYINNVWLDPSYRFYIKR